MPPGTALPATPRRWCCPTTSSTAVFVPEATNLSTDRDTNDGPDVFTWEAPATPATDGCGRARVLA